MEKNHSGETQKGKGSGIYLWIFIGVNIAFAILAVIKFIWG
jgi:hypothetical protein